MSLAVLEPEQAIKSSEKLEYILLVDDDEITNFLNERLLKRLEAANKIELATNGEEALDKINNSCEGICPTIILLDINMPVMNGLDFVKIFSTTPYFNRCKVVALTTSNHSRDHEILREYGVTTIINKPLTEQKWKEVHASL